MLPSGPRTLPSSNYPHYLLKTVLNSRIWLSFPRSPIKEHPNLVALWWGSWTCAWRCWPAAATDPPGPMPSRTPFHQISVNLNIFHTTYSLLLFSISADTCVRSAWTGSISGKQLIPRVMPPGRQNRSLRQSRFFGPSAAQSINVDENASCNCDQCHTYTFKENGR